MRLQVALSRSGITSRRKAASIIEEGRVLVNGSVIRERSHPVDLESDKIVVDGKSIDAKEKIYILLNKPRGYITSRCDPEGRKTVFDLIPSRFKNLHPVGRLDRDTTGLLILTNDGELTYRLTHPKFEIRKKYWIRCKGMIQDKEKTRLERGMVIDGKKTARAKVTLLKNNTDSSELYIEIHEGRKRQIRYMFLYLGRPVKRIERVAYESLTLGSLKKGEFRYLTNSEVRRLKEL
ncbi:MAG: rRNA pseudouridine synthase [Candidatus Omnitrophica bacterium]|nr:rRNA pseudouridine synthase [Candidatus Omnitrophota bacterium]